MRRSRRARQLTAAPCAGWSPKPAASRCWRARRRAARRGPDHAAARGVPPPGRAAQPGAGDAPLPHGPVRRRRRRELRRAAAGRGRDARRAATRTSTGSCSRRCCRSARTPRLAGVDPRNVIATVQGHRGRGRSDERPRAGGRGAAGAAAGQVAAVARAGQAGRQPARDPRSARQRPGQLRPLPAARRGDGGPRHRQPLLRASAPRRAPDLRVAALAALGLPRVTIASPAWTRAASRCSPRSGTRSPARREPR